MSSEKGLKHFMPKRINSITTIITLGGIENNGKTVWRLQVKIPFHVKLAKNYKILPFEFSKIIMTRKVICKC